MPLRYRHIGFSLSISCQWLFAFVTVFAGPISVTNGGSHGWATWIWFVVFNAISIPFGKQLSYKSKISLFSSLRFSLSFEHSLTDVVYFSLLLLP